MPTTNSTNNVATKSNKEIKKEAQAAKLLAAAQAKAATQPTVDTSNASLLAGEQAIVQSDASKPEQGSDTQPTAQEDGGDTAESNGKPDARKHGPYTSQEEAEKYPVYQLKPMVNAKVNPVAPHYVTLDSKPSMIAVYKPLGLHTVALAGHPTQYWFAMNYHHAAIQYLKTIGGNVSLCGSGKGRSSAVATANLRASEAEQRAAAAQADLIAAKQVADSQRTANVLRMVALVRSLVAAGMSADMVYGTMDATMRAEVEAGMAAV